MVYKSGNELWMKNLQIWEWIWSVSNYLMYLLRSWVYRMSKKYKIIKKKLLIKLVYLKGSLRSELNSSIGIINSFCYFLLFPIFCFSCYLFSWHPVSEKSWRNLTLICLIRSIWLISLNLGLMKCTNLSRVLPPPVNSTLNPWMVPVTPPPPGINPS